MADEVRMAWESRIGAASSNSGSPPADPTEELEVLSFDVQDIQTREDASGITGTLSVPADRMIEMSRMVAGTITFEPTPATALAWFPRAFGAAAGSPTSGVYPMTLGDTLPEIDLFGYAKSGTAGLHIFRECKITSLTLAAQEGGRLIATMGFLGKDRDAGITSSYTWPLGLTYDRASPWRFSDATLTISATAYKFYRTAFTVDNLLQPRFMSGSLTPTAFVRGMRRVMLGLSEPWGNGLPHLNTLRSSQLSTAVLKFGYGSGSSERYIQLNMPNLIPPVVRSPVIRGREEIRFDVELQACATTTAGELTDHSELTASVKAAGS